MGGAGVLYSWESCEDTSFLIPLASANIGAVCINHAIYPTRQWEWQYKLTLLPVTGCCVEYTCAGCDLLPSSICGVPVGVQV